MEQLHFITKLLDIKDPNIQILDIINKDTHKEIIAKLDYDAPSCPECGNQLKKYDFQKPSKIPYLETTGMPSRILLRKRRFKCYHCSKMMVAETPLVKKNHQLNIITVLEGRTQAVIRNHFLRYDRAVRCQVKIITMDMFSPYYGLAKQLRFQISRLRLKQSPRLFHSRMLKSFLIAFTLYNILAVL
ncbi:transposase [Streptococcus pneumoniae]|nr:transposase [Streptococcus pneumoniae]